MSDDAISIHEKLPLKSSWATFGLGVLGALCLCAQSSVAAFALCGLGAVVGFYALWVLKTQKESYTGMKLTLAGLGLNILIPVVTVGIGAYLFTSIDADATPRHSADRMISIEVPKDWRAPKTPDETLDLEFYDKRDDASFFIESMRWHGVFHTSYTAQSHLERYIQAFVTAPEASTTTQSDILPFEVGPLEGVQTDLGVFDKGTKLVFRATVLKGPTHFHLIVFTTSASNWFYRGDRLMELLQTFKDHHPAPKQSTDDLFRPIGAESPANPASEPWSTQPTDQWPQILLTNRATMTKGDSLQGASAFLIKTPSKTAFMATAKHLLGPAGGMDPPIITSELQERLVSWLLHPRTRPDNPIEASGAPYTPNVASDWLILPLKDSDAPRTFALRPRRGSPLIGEDIWLVGCPYAEANCVQNAYKCAVTLSKDDHFQCDLDPPVQLRGFSGAPFIDSRGLLVGVLSSGGSPDAQKRETVASGNSTLSIAEEMTKR